MRMPSGSVLVVDDDRGTVETLKDILEAKTYRVASACSGDAAVEMVRQGGIGAILMDIIMPGLNGVEALRALKPIFPPKKVILMTAYSRHALVEEAKREGVLAVLAKPLDMEVVLPLLERAVAA
jgi:CheY-like chemotaxis protein